MANTDGPFGFRWAGYQYNNEPTIVTFDVDSGVTGTIGRGQPVTLDVGGDIVKLSGTVATDLTNGRGVYIAQKECVAGDQEVPFIPGNWGPWIVQADDDWSFATEATTRAEIGAANNRYDINNISAINSTLGQSTAELDGSSTPVADQYLQVVDWVRSPDNEFGPFIKLIVRWNLELFRLSPHFADQIT